MGSEDEIMGWGVKLRGLGMGLWDWKHSYGVWGWDCGVKSIFMESGNGITKRAAQLRGLGMKLRDGERRYGVWIWDVGIGSRG